jgi:HK97 gp10 family phage protein
MPTDSGLAKTLAAMRRAKEAARAAVMPELEQAGRDIAITMRVLAPRDTGALEDNIEVTYPGQSTPPYSQPGGSRTAKDSEVLITAGNADVRYPHLVEYGTSDTEAQPFFWPGWRLHRKKTRDRIARRFRKELKDAWKRR